MIIRIFADFSGDTPPLTCGYDNETGKDKFCCFDNENLNSTLVVVAQTPQFPCQDHTTLCEKWLRSHPGSCHPSHRSYEFMRVACMESCGRCEDKVSPMIAFSILNSSIIMFCRVAPISTEIAPCGPKRATVLSIRNS